MGAIGRACSVVNLDPANDHTNYPCALDIRNLIKLEDIMKEDRLGPNGGILYALEELEHNYEWLEEGLKELGDDYILFDCPGQVELYTHHASLRNIFYKLQKSNYRVCYYAKFCRICAPTNSRKVRLRPPVRLDLRDATLFIRFQRPSLAPRHDSNGYAACKCAVQD
jgi:GTPase SAR1 family protein